MLSRFLTSRDLQALRLTLVTTGDRYLLTWLMFKHRKREGNDSYTFY